MEPVIAAVRQELAANVDAATRDGASRFFKEPVRLHGVKTPVVHEIARRLWAGIADRRKDEILALCETLFAAGFLEEAFVGADWAERCAPRFEPADIAVLGRWVDEYVDNWASCDTLCNHAVGDLVARYPGEVRVLREWTRSRNRWMRRAAAVSLVVPAKRGAFLDDALAIADLLLLDRDDMVQKGYGWLLKEASRHHRDEVYAFVMGRRAVMPRTALRYAVELMPGKMRTEAMRRV